MKKSPTRVFWLLFSISAVMHALLFVAWFNTEDNDYFLADKTPNISIILFANKEKTNTDTLVTETKHYKSPPRIKSLNKIEKKITKKKPKTIVSPKIEPQQESNIAAVAAEKYKRFLIFHKLLNVAINSNKHYPTSALRMQHQGIVQVRFKLLNNGKINDLEVYSSSGYNALDKAALLAVKKIQPFYAAQRYITSTQDFKVDIIFQL